MSILTPFGTLDFRDESTMRDWAGVHAIRHMTLDREMARQHHAIETVTLMGKLDEDWFGRHWLKHRSLNQVKEGATSTISFERPWRNENAFHTWHRAHNRAHVNIDRALGIQAG